MTVLLKLGGSLLTDKTKRSTYRSDVAALTSAEIARACHDIPKLSLVIGHGSGSFGHFEAHEHHTIAGVSTPEQWLGFTKVASVAAELNRLVVKDLQAVGIPAMSFQPSAASQATNGSISTWDIRNLQSALAHQIVPVVYGDVAFDSVRGGTIASTETLFDYLAAALDVTRIILVGEVDGIFDLDGKVIPRITPDNVQSLSSAFKGSEGVDVTGGMATKVRDMLSLVQARPGLTVHVINGLRANEVYKTLTQTPSQGTQIAIG